MLHLSRAAFNLEYWLLLAAFDGILLGLIPTHKIRIWLTHANARFRYDSPNAASNDSSTLRPALWAWVLPTISFLLLFAIWNPPGGHSVLSSSSTGSGRFMYFFGSPMSFEPSELTNLWLNERIFFTQPMLFLIAYPMGVWLRHNLPQRPNPYIPQDDINPPVHST